MAWGLPLDIRPRPGCFSFLATSTIFSLSPFTNEDLPPLFRPRCGYRVIPFETVPVD